MECRDLFSFEVLMAKGIAIVDADDLSLSLYVEANQIVRVWNQCSLVVHDTN